MNWEPFASFSCRTDLLSLVSSSPCRLCGCEMGREGSSGGGHEESEIGIMALGFEDGGLGVSRVLKEKRRYSYLLKVTIFPWFINLKDDDGPEG